MLGDAPASRQGAASPEALGAGLGSGVAGRSSPPVLRASHELSNAMSTVVDVYVYSR